METFALLKNTFFRFYDLNKVKKQSFSKIFAYFIFLTVILTLPIMNNAFQSLQNIKKDSQEIIRNLPDFSFEHGQLQTTKLQSGYVYQTNHIIFTFDPEGKRTSEDILTDAIGNIISIGLLKSELVFALPNNNAAVLFGENPLSISYTQDNFRNIDSDQIKKINIEETNLNFTYFIVFLVLLLMTGSSFLINLMIVVLIGNIYQKIRQYHLKFSDCFKITVYSATLPVVLSTAISIIYPEFDNSFLIVALSMYIFSVITRKSEFQAPSSP